MTRILGIDSSTKSIAWCMVAEGVFLDAGKIEFSSTDIFKQCGEAQTAAYRLFDTRQPEFVVIEGAAYINNMAVMKKLSMIQGAFMGGMSGVGVEVDEVPPVTWQKGIGNPPSNKTLVAKFARDYPELAKSTRKAKIREFRKLRTMEIIEDAFGYKTDDDDIADACGVALYTSNSMR